MPTARSVAYRVRVLPLAHELEVSLSLEGFAGEPLLLATPTWVPGAYAFMRYARDLFDVRAVDANGRPLTLRREGWSGFRLESPTDSLTVTYRAAAFDPAWGELSGLVDSDYAVLLGTRLLHAPSHRGPVRVTYEVPDGWAVHHPAGANDVGAHRFEYPSFAVLLDTPVVFGRFEVVSREVHGTRFDAVFLDRTVGFDRELPRLMDAIAKIAAECHRVFGSFPFERYSFVFSFSPTAHWGLEHANATMIALDALTFVDDKHFFDAVRVIAHELFHAWNVCRLKPFPLGKPDFVNGSFPDALWVAEGFTRWYEFVLAARAGLATPERALANVVNYFRHLRALPAYERVTAADSSLATFTNHNRYPGSVNASIDYYDKGMLIAFDLDAALRLGTPARTLDAELAAFYEAFVSSPRGFTSDEAVRFFSERSPHVATMLSREVNAPGALATPMLLEALGFELESAEVPYVGIILKDAEIVNVLDTAPAATTGLAAGDTIERVNGFPFQRQAFEWLVKHEAKLALTVKRGHRVLSFEVPVGKREDVVAMRWMGSSEQRERLASWFGQSLAWSSGQPIALGPYDNFHGIQTVL